MIFPQIRPDLSVSAVDESGLVAITDSKTGERLTLAALESWLLRHCDGETSIDTLRERFNAATGTDISAEALWATLDAFDERGWLATRPAPRAGADAPVRRRGILTGLGLATLAAITAPATPAFAQSEQASKEQSFKQAEQLAKQQEAAGKSGNEQASKEINAKQGAEQDAKEQSQKGVSEQEAKQQEADNKTTTSEQISKEKEAKQGGEQQAKSTTEQDSKEQVTKDTAEQQSKEQTAKELNTKQAEQDSKEQSIKEQSAKEANGKGNSEQTSKELDVKEGSAKAPTEIAEPTSLTLLGAGLGGLALSRLLQRRDAVEQEEKSRSDDD